MFTKKRDKAQQSEKLPAVYALLFYHGEQTPYPYSLDLADCFDDPLAVMKDMLTKSINLIDIGQVPDDDIRRQKLLGIMTGALKYRDRSILQYFKQWSESLNSIDINDNFEIDFIHSLVNYILSVGNNSADVEQFIKGSQQLSEPIRGEFMTIAEQLQAMGVEQGREEALEKIRKEASEEILEERAEQAREEIAIKLLKEGADPRFVERISGLELTLIMELKAKLDNEAEI